MQKRIACFIIISVLCCFLLPFPGNARSLDPDETMEKVKNFIPLEQENMGLLKYFSEEGNEIESWIGGLGNPVHCEHIPPVHIPKQKKKK